MSHQSNYNIKNAQYYEFAYDFEKTLQYRFIKMQIINDINN